jgi:hypothetical protein
MKRLATGVVLTLASVGAAQAESADEDLLLTYGDKETVSIAAMGATDLDEVSHREHVGL